MIVSQINKRNQRKKEQRVFNRVVCNLNGHTGLTFYNKVHYYCRDCGVTIEAVSIMDAINEVTKLYLSSGLVDNFFLVCLLHKLKKGS